MKITGRLTCDGVWPLTWPRNREVTRT